MNEGKAIVKEKNCVNCEKDSIFICFPCEKEKITDCIFCRKEDLMKMLQESKENGKCIKCEAPLHEIEMKSISLFLGENNVSDKAKPQKEEEKNPDLYSNITSTSKVSQVSKELNQENSLNPVIFVKSIPRKIDRDNVFPQNPPLAKSDKKFSESETKCAFCHMQGIVDKEIFSNENCKNVCGQIHFYHKKCLIEKAKEVRVKQGKLSDIICPQCKSEFDYSCISSIDQDLADRIVGMHHPIIIPEDDPKRLEYEACMFCKLSDNKKLIVQNNCLRKNFHHLYHNECLVKYGWETAYKGKNLSDINCFYCNSEFDYCTFKDLDNELGDKLNPYTKPKKRNEIHEVLLI